MTPLIYNLAGQKVNETIRVSYHIIKVRLQRVSPFLIALFIHKVIDKRVFHGLGIGVSRQETNSFHVGNY